MTEKTPDDVFKLAKDEKVEYVDVRFCDLPGIMQHFTIPASAFDKSVFDDGLAFDGSSIRGFQSIHESDMLLLPDPETARIDPFRAAKTLNINFFVHDPFTLEPYSRDPRNIARKAENYLISTGIADTAYFGAEAEFYIFDSVSFDSRANGSFYEVDAISGWWNTGAATEADGSPNRGYKVRHKGGYFPVAPNDQYVDLRDKMLTNLINSGFILEKGHHEVGSGGQAEINYQFNSLLHAADDMQLYKYIIKHRLAERQNGHVHAQAAVRRQRVRHALSSVAVEGRGPADVRRDGLCRSVGHGPSLHRRPVTPRAVAAGLHQPDGELLQAAGSRLRGPDQPGL